MKFIISQITKNFISIQGNTPMSQYLHYWLQSVITVILVYNYQAFIILHLHQKFFFFFLIVLSLNLPCYLWFDLVLQKLYCYDLLHLGVSKQGLAPKRACQHFWSADQHFPSANWPKHSAWPRDPLIEIEPIVFDFLEIRTCSNSYPISFSLLLKNPNLYKQRKKKIIIRGYSLLTSILPLH